MAKNIKPTLANLEREEHAISRCFEQGQQVAGSLREHVYNIKRNELWRAVDCSSFKQYCELGRVHYGDKQIELGYDRLSVLATNGEVEQQIPKSSTDDFSDRALRALGKLRVEVTDDEGNIKKTHDLDRKRIKQVVNQLIADRERAIGDDDSQITNTMVKQMIERKFGAKPPETLAVKIQKEITRSTRMLRSFEAILELEDSDLFYDAEEESPGCAKRLATAYSKIASFLRRL